jgi:hypothetical protein
MNTLKNWVLQVVSLVHTVKEDNLRWQAANQGDQAKLKHAKVLAENQLANELKMKSLALEHEIALLKAKNQAELDMFKTKCKQDIKDYEHYLASLDLLKAAIQNRYAHLPEAVAFTIHHHAKQLLNNMWEAQDSSQKIHYEMQLICFMTAIHDDAQAQVVAADKRQLPEKTITLLRQP